MPTIYFPVSHNCWGHSQPQPAGLLQDACDPGRDFRPWGNTKIQLTQQNKHSLKYSDRVCTCPVEQAGARQKKSSHEIHQFSTSSQSFPMSFKYRFYLPSWCLAEPCRDHQPSHCRVFSSRTSMSVFLKTTPSVPTPGYFTSFRISVDSTPDAGKDWNRLMTCLHGPWWKEIHQLALLRHLLCPQSPCLLEVSSYLLLISQDHIWESECLINKEIKKARSGEDLGDHP